MNVDAIPRSRRARFPALAAAALAAACGDSVGTIGPDPAPPPSPDPAPAAPTALVAGADGSHRIDLSWTDNATDEEAFEVERSGDGATGWSRIADLGANAMSWADSGLAAGEEWHYRVSALSVAGRSEYSNTAAATTEAFDRGGLTLFGTGSSNDSLYVIDVGDGTVSPLGPVRVDGVRASTPVDLAVDPSTGAAWVVNNSPGALEGVLAVDRCTGLGTVLRSGPDLSDASFDGVARSGGGVLYVASGGRIYELDADDGSTRRSVVLQGELRPAGMVVDPGGDLRVLELVNSTVASGPPRLARVNPATGALIEETRLQIEGTALAAGYLTLALAADAAGSLWASVQLQGDVGGRHFALVPVEPTDGALGEPLPLDRGPQGVALGPACP